ncbi:hypothetical protein P7C71_g3045, partial [Lecanoromycetidae sp. Uapishka_2]
MYSGIHPDRRRKVVQDAEKLRTEQERAARGEGRSDEDAADNAAPDKDHQRKGSEDKEIRQVKEEEEEPGQSILPLPKSPPSHVVPESIEHKLTRESLPKSPKSTAGKKATIFQWIETSRAAIPQPDPNRESPPTDHGPPDMRYEVPTGRCIDTIRRALDTTRMDFVLHVESSGENYESVPLDFPNQSYISQYDRLQKLFQTEFGKRYGYTRTTPTLYSLDKWTGSFGDYRIDEDDFQGQYLLERLDEETAEYKLKKEALRGHLYTGC